MQITVNSQIHQIQPTTNIQALLTQLGHAGKRLAVERNGAIAPRSTYETSCLQAGDTLEIVIAVGGG